MYDVDCRCGQSIPVELYKCGSDVACPKCRGSVRVPDSITLKARNGDPYPTLRSIEKIQHAMSDGVRPFDGRCVACKAPGVYEIPIEFSELMERFIDDDGGIRLGITGVKAVVGKAESVFQTTAFPMILCHQCSQEFEHDRPSSHLSWLKWAIFVGIVTATFQFVFEFWVVTIVATLIVVGSLFRFRDTGVGRTSVIPKWFAKWLPSIRWFPEAIHDAMEFHLAIGERRPISPTDQ